MSNLALVLLFFGSFDFLKLFLLLLFQYGAVEHIYVSEKKRAEGSGNVICKAREFSVSLETKKPVFFRLHKRQNG